MESVPHFDRNPHDLYRYSMRYDGLLRMEVLYPECKSAWTKRCKTNAPNRFSVSRPLRVLDIRDYHAAAGSWLAVLEIVAIAGGVSDRAGLR